MQGFVEVVVAQLKHFIELPSWTTFKQKNQIT